MGSEESGVFLRQALVRILAGIGVTSTLVVALFGAYGLAEYGSINPCVAFTKE